LGKEFFFPKSKATPAETSQFQNDLILLLSEMILPGAGIDRENSQQILVALAEASDTSDTNVQQFLLALSRLPDASQFLTNLLAACSVSVSDESTFTEDPLRSLKSANVIPYDKKLAVYRQYFFIDKNVQQTIRDMLENVSKNEVAFRLRTVIESFGKINNVPKPLEEANDPNKVQRLAEFTNVLPDDAKEKFSKAITSAKSSKKNRQEVIDAYHSDVVATRIKELILLIQDKTLLLKELVCLEPLYMYRALCVLETWKNSQSDDIPISTGGQSKKVPVTTLRLLFDVQGNLDEILAAIEKSSSLANFLYYLAGNHLGEINRLFEKHKILLSSSLSSLKDHLDIFWEALGDDFQDLIRICLGFLEYNFLDSRGFVTSLGADKQETVKDILVSIAQQKLNDKKWQAIKTALESNNGAPVDKNIIVDIQNYLREKRGANAPIRKQLEFRIQFSSSLKPLDNRTFSAFIR